MKNGKIEIATKYQVDSEAKLSNYTKKGSNTKENIIKVVQQQSNKKKGK